MKALNQRSEDVRWKGMGCGVEMNESSRKLYKEKEWKASLCCGYSKD
jgi:hypothetical protein